MAISFVNSATSSGTTATATVTRPSGTTADDIIVAAVYWVSSTGSETTAFSWPTGWTVIDSGGGAPVVKNRVEIAWRLHTSGTSWNVTLPTMLSGGWVSIAHAYRGADTTAPIAQHAMTPPAGASSAAALSTPTVTDATSGLWRVEFWCGLAISQSAAWGSYSPADTERADLAVTSSTYRPSMASADSGGTISAGGGTSVSATPTPAVYGRGAHIALLSPASTGPTGTADLTAPSPTVALSGGTPITYQSAASAATTSLGTSLVCNAPSGTAAGDFLLASYTHSQGSTSTPPSGWTQVGSAVDGSSGTRMYVYYKIAGGSEPASYTFTASGTETQAVNILRFTGVDATTPIRTSGTSGGINAQAVWSPLLADVSSDDMVVVLAGVRPEAGAATAGLATPSTDGWTAPAAAKAEAEPGNFESACSASYKSAAVLRGQVTTTTPCGVAVSGLSLMPALKTPGTGPLDLTVRGPAPLLLQGDVSTIVRQNSVGILIG